MTRDDSKLMVALQKQKVPPDMEASKSTPQARRRDPALAPMPARTPSLALLNRRRGANALDLDVKVLPRLEEENARLPPQDAVEFILAQIERQNALLDDDPKSVCIQSNELKAHLSTLQNLVTDSASDPADDIDWEFWSALTDDYGGVARKLSHLVSAKLRAGIPDKVRGVIWQAMAQSASLNLETMYGQLLDEPAPYERIIQRDLARTFPHVDMFKQEGGDGQRALERVLKAYSLYDSLVGYCQGLAFLVGPLLMNMPEQQAFCVFVRMMETYEMRSMFTLNMEGLQLRLHQFSSLLTQILPDLSNHLADRSVNSPMYASQWFLTLFAYSFPIPLVLRIYDIVFAEGAAETIMRVAIAMMKKSQKRIIDMNEFEDILDYLTTKLYRPYDDDPGKVIADAMALSGVITKEKMDQLAELYCCENEEKKKQTDQVLAVRLNTPKQRKRDSITWRSKRASTPVKTSQPRASTDTQDAATSHQQIEELLLSLSQAQKESIQLKQELVKTRMDKMDAEAERDALCLTLNEKVQKQNETLYAQTEIENTNLRKQLREMRRQLEASSETQAKLMEHLVDLKSKYDDIEYDKRKAQECHKEEIIVSSPECLLDERCLPEPAMLDRQAPESESNQHRHDLEAHCRELEQMLAEAKLRIAELETARSCKPTQHISHKRQSLDSSYKRTSIYGRLLSAMSAPQQDTTQPIPSAQDI